MKTKSLHSIFAILAAAAFLIPSCKVDDNFSAEKIAETDLTMTLFENGLELPLIHGDTLRIDSLVNRIPEDLKKYLKTDDNGYYILYDGSFEIKDLLSDVNLDELVSIDGVNIKDTSEFSMGTFDAADFAIEKTEFNQSVDLPDFASAIDMTIPEINQTINEKAGIYGGDYDLSLTLTGTHEVSSTILEKTVIDAAVTAAEAASITEFDLSPFFESASAVSMQDIEIEGSFLPENVTEVKDIVLKDGAAIKLTLSIENNIFSQGTIVPDITVEYGDVMSLQTYGTSLDLSSFALSSTNGYSESKTYYIEDVNEAKLFNDKKISFSGEIRVQDSPKSTTSVAKAITGDMAIKIEVEFVNVEIDDYTCVISRIDIAPETVLIDLDIDPVDLPEEVSKVNTISFTDDSAVDLVLSYVNKEYLPDLDLTLDEVRVEFPEGLTLHGEGISGNVLTVPAGTSISEGITRKVYIDEIALDNSVAGKVGFNGQLKVDVKAHADGSFKGSQVKALPSDVEVNGSVIGNIAIADFDVVLNPIEKSISYPAQSIDITGLDPAVGNFGTFVITPKQVGGKNPELEFEVSVPDLSAFPFDLGEGIVISLPDLVRFETPLDPALNYDETAHTVTITSLSSHTYVLPIKELIVTPQKADDGTYFIHSSYGVEGGIKLQNAHVHKADIEAISGEKIELNAVIPALSAQSVSLDKLQLAIPAINYDLGELIKAEDIPEMLVRINELDFGDLALDLDVQTENLPDIGTGKFNVAVKAYLPDFISPKVIDINQDIVDGKFNIHQAVALDLSAYDFEKMRAEGSAITGTIKIEGTVSAENPSVDISSISTDEPIRIMYKASVGDSEGKISLREARAAVDYQIDTTLGIGFNFDFLSSEAFEILTDFPELEFALDVKSNTALPIDAFVELTPFKDDAQLGEPLKKVAIKVPYTTDWTEQAIEHNTFSLDANRIFNEKADSLVCQANLTVDPAKDCIINTEAEYTIGLDYSVRIPMYLGENTKISYTDTLDISDANIGQYLTFAAIGLKATILNTLPLGLKLNAEMLIPDGEGGLVPLAMKKSITADIATGESLVELFIDPENLDDAEGVSHILLKFTGVSDGGYIKQDDAIIVKQLSAVLPEGITIDPNDFMNEENAE